MNRNDDLRRLQALSEKWRREAVDDGRVSLCADELDAALLAIAAERLGVKRVLLRATIGGRQN